MKQMADAFEYLHSRNIVHRDIKPQNVLYSNKGIVKIIDFDNAAAFIDGQKLYDVCGTQDYMAPEITKHGYEGPPVDVWALGILFNALFVDLELPTHIIAHLKFGKTKFGPTNRPTTYARTALVTLLTAMLRKCPMERLTMTEIVNWFNLWLNKHRSEHFLR
uniref:uncharacterized protein n=1 Tax=Myxine glutinosa TaxID=7769 RepID=UPI00358ED8AC